MALFLDADRQALLLHLKHVGLCRGFVEEADSPLSFPLVELDYEPAQHLIEFIVNLVFRQLTYFDIEFHGLPISFLHKATPVAMDPDGLLFVLFERKCSRARMLGFHYWETVR
jgi:hypothetical protein